MNQIWYYTIDGKRNGPVSPAQLKDLASKGQLLPTDMVWKNGMTSWVTASKLAGLFDTPNPNTPPPVPPPTQFENSKHYAGFWKRFAASIIDGIIVLVSNFLIGFVFGFILVASKTLDLEDMEILGNIIGIVTNWLYFSVMESSPTQATLGKIALGIKVTDLNGERISFGNATGRHFGKVISACIFLIGFLMVGFTEKKQGLHDMMAGCLVVDK